MITKSKLALVAALVAVAFTTPAFAQSASFNSTDSAAFNAYLDLPPSYWDQTAQSKQTVVHNGYNAYAKVTGEQTAQPSAGEAIGGLSWH